MDNNEKIIKTLEELCKSHEIAISNLKRIVDMLCKENKIQARKIRDLETKINSVKTK